ncbi:hypothetical protein OH76DRAFT_1345325 [Lentinus brumalis]|uniref:CxC2-like cysteine cluster KDZ transposase-associated domain-containing protein n=1 Tax=Lentinus brumalis TaxID=2498619 RepID=A0A371DIQ6_9APHY|nr:hypothetical protein OH76DRAFT_1345325 [Polyporus brumalis]
MLQLPVSSLVSLRFCSFKLTRKPGRPCDEEGTVLPYGAPPPPPSSGSQNDWTPYQDRVAFELAELLYKKEQMSAGNIDALLQLWSASLLAHGDSPPFRNHNDLYDTIDDTVVGSVSWSCFSLAYDGPRPSGATPSWMSDKHTIYYRDPRALAVNMLGNPGFKSEIMFGPTRQFGHDGRRILRDFMGGDWAWKQADLIAELPDAQDSSFIPIVLGSDKTTVSVATGQNEYYPVYLSIGNVCNSVRRAHRDAVTLVAFLACPKSNKKHANSADFRKFRRQLFHSSLSRILRSLRSEMTEPVIVRCGDGHFRKIFFGLGPYIADYPEQALVASVVQGWCPICTAPNKDLDGEDANRRPRSITDYMVREFELGALWEDYGIVGDVVPFTNDFPRADIHELVAPDILHQLIKGIFKDHLVTWVEKYLTRTFGDAKAAEVVTEIDRRIAVVPPFSKLRHFHEGRGFKQWTGDDSKALMKASRLEYRPGLCTD